MDLARSSGNVEDNVGIPEDLRCKRSDGKQWRCSALSMPDKTVCEKHYIQAKKRATNSALRASLKKAKRKSIDESDIYFECKNDEVDIPLSNTKCGEFCSATPAKRYKEKMPKNQHSYSPETMTRRSLSTRTPMKSDEDSQRDIALFDENCNRSAYKNRPSDLDSLRSKFQKNSNGIAIGDHSNKSSDSSGEAGGETCHQCRQNDRETVIWCLRCRKRGYCSGCISKWYSDLQLADIQRACPACCGTCNCKVCFRGDNLIKVRIWEIPGRDKLQYLHCLLSLVLPVLNQIYSEQLSELNMNSKFHGNRKDIPRAKMNADEQMCCDCCKIPIIDYHWHCSHCLYDLCLTCCRDLRQMSLVDAGKTESRECRLEKSHDGVVVNKELNSSEPTLGSGNLVMDLAQIFPGWKANSDGSIPCPPKEFGGCGYHSLTLRRIFKMNWVAKLLKNAKEMVNGCKVYDTESSKKCISCLEEKAYQCNVQGDSKLFQSSHREDTNDNFLYFPSSEDIKHECVGHFQKHWRRGEPIIVKDMFDHSLASSWDPMVLWRGMREMTDERVKDENITVKAIDCLDGSEIDIELSQFIKGYSEGRNHENGWPEMLKLKDWPPPSALEEFLLCRMPDFISNLPLLEYIHSKWGLLNLAAKLPHDSLQPDAGPKIYIAYGAYEELGKGDSVTNLCVNMGDVVYLLMHTTEVKFQDWQLAKIEKIQKSFKEPSAEESIGDARTEPERNLEETGNSSDSARNEHQRENDLGLVLNGKEDRIMEDQVHNGIEIPSAEKKETGSPFSDKGIEDVVSKNTHAGAVWDIFRRQDVPKLNEYLRLHRSEIRRSATQGSNSVMHPIYDQAVFLSKDHKRKLKDEVEIEPWTIEQHVGEAVFIPAGCAFQVRSLQSSVQLGLDFLSPESLEKSICLAKEIRCLPNDHETKLQMLEVEKMSLYASSWANREIQKLTLDPKVGPELGFEDRNLTALVLENIEKMTKRRQIACI